jgi:uncharacterized protein
MTGKRPKQKSRPGVDKLGRTPMHYAAATGDASAIAALLSRGANVNATDDNGWSPLHFSTQENRLEISRVLLAAGANVDAVDTNGNTPLSNAVFSSKGRGDLIELLRTYGADPLRKNHHGISPLGLARSIGNFDVRRFFDDLPPA